MGCHTWFYIPVDMSNYKHKSAKQEVIKWYSENLISTNAKEQQCNKLLLKVIKYSYSHNGILEAWLGIKEYRMFDSIVYKQELNYHDIFRIEGYPKLTLRCYEDFAKLVLHGTLADKDEYDSPTIVFPQISINHSNTDVMNKVKQFFIDNPKGIIKFG